MAGERVVAVRALPVCVIETVKVSDAPLESSKSAKHSLALVESLSINKSSVDLCVTLPVHAPLTCVIDDADGADGALLPLPHAGATIRSRATQPRLNIAGLTAAPSTWSA